MGTAVFGVAVLGAKYDLGCHVQEIGSRGKAGIGGEDEDSRRDGSRWGNDFGDGGNVGSGAGGIKVHLQVDAYEALGEVWRCHWRTV